jgi:hypothetical protein
MEDNLRNKHTKNGRRPQNFFLKKMEDDLKNKMEDEPINQNQPNWL